MKKMLKKFINGLKRPLTKTHLNQFIFFVTSKCNLKCEHCFNWRQLNSHDDLNFSEIQKISQNLPPFNLLLLSGGEPFLRKNLPQIIRLFFTNNKISFVGIPTNGTLCKTIASQVEKILKISPRLSVNLYFSLDGLPFFHNKTRGAANTFEKVLQSITKVNYLKKDYPNLSVNINTVILRSNLKQLKKFTDFIYSQGENFIDGHYFELVRGSPKNPSLKNISPHQLKNLYEKVILPYQEKIFHRQKDSRFLNFFLAKFALANFAFQYKVQYENYIFNKPWKMPCLAGKSIFVIDSNADLRLCELRNPVANLRNAQYNFKNYLLGKKAKKDIAKIDREKCFCTHGCFITESMYKNPKIMFFDLPLLFFKNLKKYSLK